MEKATQFKSMVEGTEEEGVAFVGRRREGTMQINIDDHRGK